MAKQKKWSSEEKIAVVLEGLKGRSPSEITKEYGMSEAQYYKWRETALNSMQVAFQDKRTKDFKTKSFDAERDRLLRTIGEQKVIIDLQKKLQRAFKHCSKA